MLSFRHRTDKSEVLSKEEKSQQEYERKEKIEKNMPRTCIAGPGLFEE